MHLHLKHIILFAGGPKLTMKKSTLFILLSAVTCMCLIQSIECSPLFFDLFKNIFGGNRNRPNNRPSYNNRPNNNRPNNRPNNQWPNGGQMVRQKKYPWDIFGMFGFKGVFINLCTSHPLISYCMLW